MGRGSLRCRLFESGDEQRRRDGRAAARPFEAPCKSSPDRNEPWKAGLFLIISGSRDHLTKGIR
jgi:hypothetical protein